MQRRTFFKAVAGERLAQGDVQELFEDQGVNTGIPYKCEICGGSGQMPTDTTATYLLCQGCGGSGIVYDHTVIQPVFVIDVHSDEGVTWS